MHHGKSKPFFAMPAFKMPHLKFPSLKLPAVRFPKVSLPKVGVPAYHERYSPQEFSLPKIPYGQRGILASWVYALVFPVNVFHSESSAAHGFERVAINFCLPWLGFFTLFFSSRLFTKGSIGQVGFPEVFVAFVVLAFLSSILFANFGVLHSFLVVVAAKLLGAHKANLVMQARLFSTAYAAGSVLLAGVLFATYSLRVIGLQQIGALFAVVWALYWLALLSLATRESTGLPFSKAITASVVPTALLFGIVLAAVAYLNALPA